MTSKLKVNLINDSGDNNIITSDGSGNVTLGTAFPSVGKIGQVVTTAHTSNVNTSSTSYVDVSGFSASITPSSTSSKILILTDMQFYVAGNSQGNNGYVQIVRDSTAIVQRRSQTYNQASASGIEYENQISFVYTDSPSTTSSVTYKIQFRLGNGSNVYLNHGSSQTGSITLMEVLA